MKEKRPETNPSVLRTCDLGIFKVKNFLSYFFRRKFISLYVSGKLPTYSSPKPTLTLASHLGQKVGLVEGYGSFLETCI